MRAGFAGGVAGAGARRARRLLRGMLAACAGAAGPVPEGGEVREATNCSRAQMEASVSAWASSHRAVLSLLSLQGDPRGGFREFDHPKVGAPCGAGLRKTPKIKCVWNRPMCYDFEDQVAAWSLASVCFSPCCVCDPTNATKRVAKLGLAGAMAIVGTHNMTNSSDWRSTPACGDGWEGVWMGEPLKGLKSMVTVPEAPQFETLVEAFSGSPRDRAAILNADKATVDVALFKSARQQLTKGGPLERVCMISWQSSHRPGDWKINFMTEEVEFPFVRDQGLLKLPHGLVQAYQTVRLAVRTAFQRECCTSRFHANRLVISGHSHGGAMAEMNAVDAISWWTCGKKLTADDISVVLIAPHNRFMTMQALTEIWSCSDRVRCLAGSAVTLVNDGDYVGGTAPLTQASGPGKALLHPSSVTQLPCETEPESFHRSGARRTVASRGHCHDLVMYARNVEEVLVDQQEWGSTCNGVCGDPNRQLQCGAWQGAMARSCLDARPEDLGEPTPCGPEGAWRPEREKCECRLDGCDSPLAAACR
mmetsp:Transcript_101519/g.316562  ORF Transcript_101519/g.316562 Transcript_101519/m.316562 type:complete len:534 (+) Transcript_101519:60-1661(+)